MGVVLRARFDGKAIIPDEPINLPEGTVLEVEFRVLPPEGRGSLRLYPPVPNDRLSGARSCRCFCPSWPSPWGP